MAVRPGTVETVDVTGQVDPTFWKGKRVLLTGHTGFKGSWCALWLARMGAQVTGFALPPDSRPNLYDGAGVADDIESQFGDVRDPEAVVRVVESTRPDIVLHFAAQALVRRSVQDPIGSFATNVLGTAHLLNALRGNPDTKAVLVVTTDKVYENPDLRRPFVESDPLGGHDPYSASKAAAEIVTQSMRRTYFSAPGMPVATARGGNVIGGGDYAEDRLVPDVVRAVESNAPILLRYPDAVRPWQHVLDCIAGYLVYTQALTDNVDVPRSLNIGPEDAASFSVRQIAEAMLDALGSKQGWKRDPSPGPAEANFISLDTSRIRDCLQWRDRFPGEAALIATASWYRDVRGGKSMRDATLGQIAEFMHHDRQTLASTDK